MRLACLLLDWNGTLLNDLPVTYDAVREIFRRHGVPAPTLGAYRNEIDSNFTAFSHARGIHGEVTAKELNDIWQEVVTAHWEEVTLHAGARELLRACLGRSLTLGIVSGEVPIVLARRLEQFAIGHFFSRVRGGAWPKEGAFYETLAALGFLPGEVGYVDDTTEGIRTAKRLGMRTFGFTGGYASPERIRSAEPHHVVASFAELSRLLAAE